MYKMTSTHVFSEQTKAENHFLCTSTLYLWTHLLLVGITQGTPFLSNFHMAHTFHRLHLSWISDEECLCFSFNWCPECCSHIFVLILFLFLTLPVCQSYLTARLLFGHTRHTCILNMRLWSSYLVCSFPKLPLCSACLLQFSSHIVMDSMMVPEKECPHPDPEPVKVYIFGKAPLNICSRM